MSCCMATPTLLNLIGWHEDVLQSYKSAAMADTRFVFTEPFKISISILFSSNLSCAWIWKAKPNWICKCRLNLGSKHLIYTRLSLATKIWLSGSSVCLQYWQHVDKKDYVWLIRTYAFAFIHKHEHYVWCITDLPQQLPKLSYADIDWYSL